eukprot:271615_1
MTTLFTFGLIFLCIGTIIKLYHPLNSYKCNLINYCFGLGAILTIMSPLCKTYRVALIFGSARNFKRVTISDKQLLLYLTSAVIIEFGICIIYTLLHEINGGFDVIYLTEYNRIENVCNQNSTVKYIQYANYLYMFTLLMILCFFSYKNRLSHKMFKESRCAYFGSFFSLFVFIIGIIFNISVHDESIIVTMQSLLAFIALCVIWILFYGVRIYKFYTDPTQRKLIEALSIVKEVNSPQPNSHQTPPQVSPQNSNIRISATPQMQQITAGNTSIKAQGNNIDNNTVNNNNVGNGNKCRIYFVFMC